MNDYHQLSQIERRAEAAYDFLLTLAIVFGVAAVVASLWCF